MAKAQLATWVIFFLTGTVGAAWATRIPAIQDQLALSPGAMSVAVLGLEGGALVGLPLGGILVARAGSRRALMLGFVTYPTALLAVAAAPRLVALAGALALMALGNSVVDVAMNAQGVELERRYGRAVLAGLHAGHSIGLLTGGLAGVAAAGAGMPVPAHFGLTAAVGVAGAGLATRWLVRESAAGPEARVLARPGRSLLLLGAVAFGAFWLDGAAYNWSAAHLRDAHDAGPGVAAAAFATIALALAVGRLGTDRLVNRAGRMRVIRGAGLVTAAGALVAIVGPTAPVSLAGWGVFGLGLSAVAPAVLGAAPDADPATAAPVAIAAVTTVGYLGSFTGAPFIGAVAATTGLPAALGVLVLVALAITLLARRALPETQPLCQGRPSRASNLPRHDGDKDPSGDGRNGRRNTG